MDDASSIFKDKPCFLTFVRGIQDVNDLRMIEVSFNIFQDQQNWESNNGHTCQVSDHIHDVVGTRKAARYYRQATLNGCNCDCRISFGGDCKWKRATCPRAANAHIHGQLFENCLIKNMKQNHADLFPQDAALPHRLKFGTFHVFFNEYNHLEGNSIAFHDDVGETYSHEALEDLPPAFLIQYAPLHSKVLEFFWSSASLRPRVRGVTRRAKHPFFCCFRVRSL